MSARVSALGIELIIVDPLIPANRGVLMDRRLDLGASKADSGVNKVVWEVNLEALGREDKGSEGDMYCRPSSRSNAEK